MINTICLNEKYSTTKILTKEKPIIENNPENKFESILFLPKSETRKGEGGLRTKGYFKKSYDDKPLISIITVVFNGEKYLEETIQSVMNQSYENVEYIIIDGGSIDGTIDIIRQYEDKIDYWVSERDRGIYDAMNKGISLVTGDYVGLVNADDSYHIFTLQKVIDRINENKKNKDAVIYGLTSRVENNSIISVSDTIFDKELLYLGFQFSHTSIFTSLDTYKNIGLFNTDYKIAGDTDWLLRAFKTNVEFIKNDHKNYMKTGGISHKYQSEALKEYARVLKKHLPHYYENNIDKILKHQQKIKIASKVRKTFIFNVLRKILMSIKKNLMNFCMVLFNYVHNFLFIHTVKNKFFKTFGIQIGKKSYIHVGVRLYTVSNLEIGDNTTINRNCLVDNRHKITIGDNVNIGHSCKIYTCGHDYQSSYFDFTSAEVIIEDNVVLYSNILVMPGVTLAEGSVILPGSVITKDTKKFCVYGGNPARKVANRNNQLYYKLDYNNWFAN